jgi:predicted DNA-binding protein (MmcQ/YjbR family)
MGRSKTNGRAQPIPGADPFLIRVRKLCLSLPEVTETASWGHPNFRAGRRTFLAFEHFGGIDSVAFRLDSHEVEALMKQQSFARTPYGQGKWVSLPVRPRPGWALVETLVLRSYRLMALKRMIAAMDLRPVV